jgi:hypothetical protein
VDKHIKSRNLNLNDFRPVFKNMSKNLVHFYTFFLNIKNSTNFHVPRRSIFQCPRKIYNFVSLLRIFHNTIIFIKLNEAFPSRKIGKIIQSSNPIEFSFVGKFKKFPVKESVSLKIKNMNTGVQDKNNAYHNVIRVQNSFILTLWYALFLPCTPE